MSDTIRNVLLVLGIALSVGVAAWLFSSSQEEQYESSMQLLYGRLVSPELQLLGAQFAEPDVDEEVRLATEARALDSIDVAEATAKANPRLRMTGAEIASRVNPSPVRGSLVVRLVARAPNAFAATVLVRAYAQEFLRLRRQNERRGALRVEEALRKRFAALSAAEKASLPGVGLRNQIAALALLRRVGTGSPQIIEEPRVASSPVTPNTQRDVVFGVLLGLAVGVGLVALRSGGRGRDAVAAARRAGAIARGEPAQRR